MLCEIDRPARAVLEARFSDAALHDDVCTLGALPRETELLVGGFPCQDLSQAGQTRGIGGSRSGLVGEVFRLLERRRVPWVLLENVPFMLQLGRGRALALVLEELERLGYHWAYRVVDTRAFGLPQRRQRVFILASQIADPRSVLFADDAGAPESIDKKNDIGGAFGFYWTEGVRGLGWAVDAVPTLKGGSTIGVPSPPAILMPDREIVTPSIRDAERLQGFRMDWTKPAERVAKPGMRWKLVGNAVTVRVARWLGGRLASPGDAELKGTRPLASNSKWPDAAWNVGAGRHTAEISRWPKRFKFTPIQEFLVDPPKKLSHRATAGFLKRTSKGRLRFPDGFIAAVESHLGTMAD